MDDIWTMGYKEVSDMSRMEKRRFFRSLSSWTQANLHPSKIGRTIRRIAKYTVYGFLHMISLIGVIILGLVIGIAAIGSWLSGLLFGRK